MFLLILVQIYKKNGGKPHVERNIYKEKTYIIRWGLIFCMKKGNFLPVNATFACGFKNGLKTHKLQKQHALVEDP